MKDQIRMIWERNNQNWLKARQDIKNTLGVKISQQEVYDIINNVTDRERVAPCGELKKFTRWDRGYQFCSNNCSCATESKIRESEKTSLAKYGTKNPMCNQLVKDRFKKSMLETYGAEHPLQVEKFKTKARETTRKNHGVDYSLQSADVRLKSKVTNLARYGVDNPLKSKKIREKMANTMMNRYGGSHTMSSQMLRDKSLQTTRDRYGRDHHTQRHISDTALSILNDRELLREYVSSRSFQTASKELGIDTGTIVRYWENHGLLKPQGGSSQELEITAFLKSLDVEFIRNSRKIIAPLELDFYLPDYKLAIEFNGLYWHSSAIRDNDYHRRKYQACRDRGIRLLMINEDEWLMRNQAWRDRLKNILKKSNKGLAARKLQLKTISQPRMNSFCGVHHIQGATSGAIYCLGAFSDNVLVGIMAFSKQRGTQKIELIRFCTDGDNHAGLFSKMFSHSIREAKFTEILSFADLRHSDGNVYSMNGFELVYETKPDYRYVYEGETYHKSVFTKKRIGEKFGLDMEQLTERQAMEILDIPRIYDCGKFKFTWRSKA